MDNNQKPLNEFSMKDWKNSGIYIILLGLIIIFLGKEWKIGGGLFLVGVVFTMIFQGPKIFKILKKKNW
ncbi:hypothetical protein J4204_05840 [Candidatus Woesearchaeota archaeon]|nr:hypothetical protein [Candidatus Woesearchaeota archaeon]